MREGKEVRGYIIISMAFISLISGTSPIFAYDYLQEGRLTKRTPGMERVADEIYAEDPNNFIFNAMNFSMNYLKDEEWIGYGFYSAQYSFEKRVGSCSEIAVLYCSMLRYKGIPCTFRIVKIDQQFNDMFPIILLNGSWYKPHFYRPLWSSNYWGLVPEWLALRDRLDITNGYTVKEW